MRIWKALLVCFCSMLNVEAASVWVPISSNEPVRSEINVIAQSATETILFVRLEGFYLDCSDDGSCSVGLPGAAKLLEPGAPELSKLVASLIIPDEGDVEVIVESSSYKDFPNLDVVPSKGNIYRNQHPTALPLTRSSVYKDHGFYPGKIVEQGAPYTLRDFRGMPLSVFPLQYHPLDKTLRVYHAMTIRIRSVGSGTVPAKKTLSSVDAAFLPIYTSHFINFNALNYTPLVDQGRMLVLCDSSLVPAMASFIQWKNRMGQPTEVVPVQQAGQTPGQIKAFVEDYYFNFGLTFLLLVGDAPQIPPYNSSSGDSDPSYGYILGQDSYAEVFVGRFSATAVDEVLTQVDRTIAYELHPDTVSSAYDKAVCIASSQGPGDDNEYDYEHERNIRQDLLAYNYHSADELYDGTQGLADFPGNPTPLDLTSALNAGRGLVTYTGHGSSNGFLTTGFGLSDIPGLTSSATLPFIWSVACVNGNFSSGTCLAEGLLRASDSSGNPTGAVAAFMSTINQSWDPPMDAQDEMVDVLVEAYPGNIRRTFGGLAVNGCLHMNDQYGSAGYEMTDTWTCFGDPSLMVRTAAPQPIIVSHPGVIPESGSGFQCSVNFDGALACISRHDSILGTGWVVAGNCNIPLASIHVGDTLLLTVTGYNAIPYQANVHVVSSSTGIMPADDVALVQVYPNPAQHIVSVKLHGLESPKGTIELINGAGQVLQVIGVNNETVTDLDVSGLARGSYRIRIYSGSRQQVIPLLLQ